MIVKAYTSSCHEDIQKSFNTVKMQSKRKKQQIRACTNIKSNITVQPAIQAKNN